MVDINDYLGEILMLVTPLYSVPVSSHTALDLEMLISERHIVKIPKS